MVVQAADQGGKRIICILRGIHCHHVIGQSDFKQRLWTVPNVFHKGGRSLGSSAIFIQIQASQAQTPLPHALEDASNIVIAEPISCKVQSA